MSPSTTVSAAPERPLSRWLIALALFVVPALLRLAPIHHGGARNYVPDTHIVRNALGMAKDKDLVPPVGKYSTYPHLLPYCLLPIYAVEYVGGRALGAWSGSGEFGQRVLEEPAIAQWPARYLVALFGLLTPWVVWRAARAAGLSSRAALVAGWLVATSLLHVQFSTHERPWVPLVFFAALAQWAAALYAREGRGKQLALCGLAAAGAFSTHQAGLPMIALAALAWALGPLGWSGAALRRRLAQGVACVALFALVSLLIGHPYYLVHGSAPREQISGGEGLERALAEAPDDFGFVFHIGGQAIALGMRAESIRHLSKALCGYDPVLVLLGLLGTWSALRRPGLRAAAGFGLAWAAFFLTNRNDHVRYLLPLVVLWAPAAGLCVDLLWGRSWMRALLLAALALPLAQALRLDWLLRREDTRALAEARLEATPGLGLVALDRYPPQLELDRASLERIAQWRPLGSRERHRLEGLTAGVLVGGKAGIAALPLEDAFFFDEREQRLIPNPKVVPAGEELGAFLRSQGATHLLMVSKRPDLLREHLLMPLVAGQEPLWDVDPRQPGTHPEEAFLPTEMEFPLSELWQVERPGPRVRLYELPRR